MAAGLGGVVGGGLFASQSIMSSGGANRSTMLRGRKRKRKRRHVFKDDAPDVRPDEELMWDIESRPDDSRPLLIYAERLVVRGQTSRAQSYLKRALLMEEREAAASFSAVDGMQGTHSTSFGVDGESMTSLHGTSVVSVNPDGRGNKLTVAHANRIELMLRLGTLYVLDEHYGKQNYLYIYIHIKTE